MPAPKTPKVENLAFQATFVRATTTVDGGWNVTFAVSQDEAKALMQLATLRETLLQIAVIPLGTRFTV